MNCGTVNFYLHADSQADEIAARCIGLRMEHLVEQCVDQGVVQCVQLRVDVLSSVVMC